MDKCISMPPLSKTVNHAIINSDKKQKFSIRTGEIRLNRHRLHDYMKWICAAMMLTAILGTPMALRAQPVSNRVDKVVFCGDHTHIIDDTGKVWGFGNNEKAQLGLGNTNTIKQPTRMDLYEVVKIVHGRFAYALCQDGSLWGWGMAENDIMGDGGTGGSKAPVRLFTSGINDIAINDVGVYALKQDGSLFVWGNNEQGYLGMGSKGNKVMTPVQMMDHGVQSVWAVGSRGYMLKSGGQLWGWGKNDDGLLGDGMRGDRLAPKMIIDSNVKTMRVANDHAVVIKRDASLWSWGQNALNQVNMAPDEIISTPVQIIAKGVKDAVVDLGRTYAIYSAGGARAWGNNQGGMLGLGAQNVIKMPNPLTTEPISQISLSRAGGMAINKEGQLWVWGDVATLLGAADPTMIFKTEQEAISAMGSGKSLLILQSKGTLLAIGDNRLGQLGVPNMPQVKKFTAVVTADAIVRVTKSTSTSLLEKVKGMALVGVLLVAAIYFAFKGYRIERRRARKHRRRHKTVHQDKTRVYRHRREKIATNKRKAFRFHRKPISQTNRRLPNKRKPFEWKNRT